MAQGAIKKSSKPSASSKKPTHQTSKPNHRARVIKPKKASLIAQAKLKKKSTSGLTGKTERLLAERAGHLEVLRGGKNDKKKGAEGGKGKES